MSRSLFGWSYPAGCSSVPGDEPDPPDTCPGCGADNVDADGEPVNPDDPFFCSAVCAEKYTEQERAAADAEAAERKEEADLPDWWEDHATGPGTDGDSDGETLEEEADRRAHDWDDLEPEER